MNIISEHTVLNTNKIMEYNSYQYIVDQPADENISRYEN